MPIGNILVTHTSEGFKKIKIILYRNYLPRRFKFKSTIPKNIVKYQPLPLH